MQADFPVVFSLMEINKRIKEIPRSTLKTGNPEWVPAN